MNDVDDERVVVLAPIGRDAELALHMLGRAGHGAHACRDIDELCEAIAAGAGCALVTEESLTRAAAQRLVEQLAHQPPWSDFPIIAFSANSTRASSAEALRILGNVTVLDRPVQVRSMMFAVGAALRARRRQYEGKRAIEQRDQFLAMLGHKLRNPLGAILFASQLMEAASPEALARHRAVVDRQAQHLARLVDDLLDVSRVTSGKVVLKRTAVDLRELVERSAQAAEAMVRAQDQTLRTRGPASPVLVDGDPVRLQQVVTNLLANASKYTPRGGHVDLELGYADGEALLSVRDDGVGIDASLIGNIFELFTQAPGSLDRSQGGMGLGLTLVRALVTLHGGSVEARSDGVGKGSEFVVRVPARCGPAEALAKESPSEAPAPKLRVVIVDDNFDVRDTMLIVLESYGHTIEGAEEDGTQGLERILAAKPDVAIIDIGLAGLDGYQLAKRVRATLGDSVRLIALTGYGQPDDRSRARAAGFDVHLTKPVQCDVLARALYAREPTTDGAR